MEIRFAPLYSSSSGNSTFIGAGDTRILVDAGVTGKNIEQALNTINEDPHGISGILVTHEHSDHIKGIGVLSRKYDIPVYANALTWEAMEDKIGDISLRNIRVVDKTEFYIGDMCILPVELSHDAADPVGYSVMAGKSKVSILTDTGKVTARMLDRLEGSQVVLLEANHDVNMLKNGPYPQALKQRILSNHGHLSNMSAAAAALELYRKNVREIILGHISSHNNIKELALRTVKAYVESQGVDTESEVEIVTANRKSVTGMYLAEA